MLQIMNKIEALQKSVDEYHETVLQYRQVSKSVIEKLKSERDEARAVVRELWDMSETYLEFSDEQLERIHRCATWEVKK